MVALHSFPVVRVIYPFSRLAVSPTHLRFRISHIPLLFYICCLHDPPFIVDFKFRSEFFLNKQNIQRTIPAINSEFWWMKFSKTLIGLSFEFIAEIWYILCFFDQKNFGIRFEINHDSREQLTHILVIIFLIFYILIIMIMLHVNCTTFV